MSFTIHPIALNSHALRVVEAVGPDKFLEDELVEFFSWFDNLIRSEASVADKHNSKVCELFGTVYNSIADCGKEIAQKAHVYSPLLPGTLRFDLMPSSDSVTVKEVIYKLLISYKLSDADSIKLFNSMAILIADEGNKVATAEMVISKLPPSVASRVLAHRN